MVPVELPEVAIGEHRPVAVKADVLLHLESVLRPLFSYSSPEANSQYFIVDQKQQIFGKHGAALGLVPANRQLVQRLAKQASPGSGERIAIDGQNVIAAYSPVPSLEWGVLISIPTAALEEALWKAERVLAFFGGVMLLLECTAGGVAELSFHD